MAEARVHLRRLLQEEEQGMRKFEYRTVNPNEEALKHPTGQRLAVDLLNDLGQEGWELIMIKDIFKDDEEWVMKRELTDQSTVT